MISLLLNTSSFLYAQNYQYKCFEISLFFRFYPVDKGHSTAHDLHRPHPQPEAQRPAQVSNEGGEGELRDVGFGHCHLGVYEQSKDGCIFQDIWEGREGSHWYLGDVRFNVAWSQIMYLWWQTRIWAVRNQISIYKVTIILLNFYWTNIYSENNAAFVLKGKALTCLPQIKCPLKSKCLLPYMLA